MRRDYYINQNFLGVFSLDQFLNLEIHDDNRKRFLLVVNEQPSWKEGSHWLLVFKNKDNVYFIDSLGRTPSYYGLHDRICNLGDNMIFINNTPLQCYNSSTCGAYSIYFSYYFQREVAFDEILNDFSLHRENNDAIVLKFLREKFNLF